MTISIDTRMTTKPSIEFNDISYDLLDLNMDYAHVLLPIIVYIIIMIFVGGLGNSVVLLVYYKAFKPSSTRIFILSLGVINLVACVLNFPSKIVEYCYHYTFHSPEACRSMYVLRSTLVMSTGFICVSIAMDRHRRVCRQYTSQWSAKDARKAVGVCVKRTKLNESRLKSAAVRRHTSEREFLRSELHSATEGSRVEVDITEEKCVGGQEIELSDLTGLLGNVQSTDASHDISRPNVVATQSSSGTADRTECMDVNINTEQQKARIHVMAAEVSPSPPGNMEQLADTGFKVPLPPSHVTGHSWPLCSTCLARLQPLLRTLKCCIVDTCPSSSSSSTTMTSSPTGQTFRAEGNARAKKIFSTTTLTLLVMTFIFLLGYIPTLTILSIQAAEGYSEDVTRPWMMNLHQLCLLSTYLCFCLSPIVHCICSIRFRRQLRRMFCSDI